MKNIVETPLDPEASYQDRCEKTTLFLAGTIDDGNSYNWQADVISKLSDSNLIIYNPRRDNWNKTATEQDIINQIDWEQDKILDSDYILFNFLPDSISPITLLELGQCLEMSENLQMTVLVCCPKEYFRYINVKHMCSRYCVSFFENLDSIIRLLA